MVREIARIAAVFVVAEEEYEALRLACPGDFPFAYAVWMARINDALKHQPEGITLLPVECKVGEFVAWRDESKVHPNNVARSAFAALVLGRSLDLG